MNLQAVIFDFDGTMVDTESCAYDAWAEIYQEFGCQLPLSEWQRCVGASYSAFDPVDYLSQLSGQEHDRDALMARKNAVKSERADQSPLLPGVQELIIEAQNIGLKLAVASSSPYDWVHHHLTRTGLRDLFPIVVTKEDVKRVKPDPQIFLTAAERLEIAPSACLVLEDSLNGILAAKKAGMVCVAVPGPITKSLDFSTADIRLGSLLELNLKSL